MSLKNNVKWKNPDTYILYRFCIKFKKLICGVKIRVVVIVGKGWMVSDWEETQISGILAVWSPNGEYVSGLLCENISKCILSFGSLLFCYNSTNTLKNS